MSEPKQYPRMLYGPEGTTKTVKDEDEHKAAGGDWKTAPDDSHRSAAPAPPPLQSGQEAFIEAIAVRTSELVLAALNAPPDPQARINPPPGGLTVDSPKPVKLAKPEKE